VPQATDVLSALSVSRLYWGAYNGALAIVKGAVFHHLLGILVFSYPTLSLASFYQKPGP
jgi:hypothetical protein